MSLQRHLAFWVLALVGFLAFLWLFREVLPPFFAAMALAYLLDPVADRLERIGMGRIWATAAIVGTAFALFSVLIVLILPTVIGQIGAFFERLPEILTALQRFLSDRLAGWVSETLRVDPEEIQAAVTDFVAQSSTWVSGLLRSVVSGGAAALGFLGFFVVTPVVTFYLLADWDRLTARIDHLLPRDHAETIRDLARQIDDALAGFVRGQLTVSVILATFYAIALSALGLNYALAIGITAGLINIIPYVGSVLGFVIAVGVAVFQFWPDWVLIVAVGAVFVIGQVVEGNVLQPLLVGDKVGLHPVSLMFAIVAFSYLFGIAGTLFAVPAAAAVGVLVRFAIDKYLNSPLYTGHRQGGETAAKEQDG